MRTRAGGPCSGKRDQYTARYADVLAMVDDQFVALRTELSVQLTRRGQIHAQLDQIHTMVKKLVHQGN